jgi:hypothetical protein
VIIFQDEPDNWQYHALTQELRNYGSPSKKIVCVNAVLYVFDLRQGAMVEIPVSGWKLGGALGLSRRRADRAIGGLDPRVKLTGSRAVPRPSASSKPLKQALTLPSTGDRQAPRHAPY